jgi:tryptophan-rich sensory protein
MRDEKRIHPAIALLLFLTATYLTGVFGSFATERGLPYWYVTLQKPSWNPPPWVFAPVWTVLYGLMGFAAWLVWQTPASRLRMVALVLFGIQLVLNGLWSWLFFGFQRIDLALYEIVVLLLAIVLTTIQFGRLRSLAGWLMAPYIAWVLFATVLNFTLHGLNPPPPSGPGIPPPQSAP